MQIICTHLRTTVDVVRFRICLTSPRTCFERVNAGRKPSLVMPQQQQHCVFGKRLKVVTVLDLGSIAFQDDANGLRNWYV